MHLTRLTIKIVMPGVLATQFIRACIAISSVDCVCFHMPCYICRLYFPATTTIEGFKAFLSILPRHSFTALQWTVKSLNSFSDFSTPFAVSYSSLLFLFFCLIFIWCSPLSFAFIINNCTAI